MKKQDVTLNKIYAVKVSGKIAPVQLVREVEVRTLIGRQAFGPPRTIGAYSPVGPTEVFTVREGAWHLLLDGVMVNADFNSKGAASAAIEVERARRRGRVERKALEATNA